jgi:hypothetical protein
VLNINQIIFKVILKVFLCRHLSSTTGLFQHFVAEVLVRITESHEGKWMQRNRLFSVESDGQL